MTGENADILNALFQSWSSSTSLDYFPSSDIYDPEGLYSSGEVSISRYDNGDGTYGVRFDVDPDTYIPSGTPFVLRQHPIANSIAPTFLEYELTVLSTSNDYEVGVTIRKDAFLDISRMKDTSSSGTFTMRSEDCPLDSTYERSHADRTWTKSNNSNTYGIEGLGIAFNTKSDAYDSISFVINYIKLLNSGSNSNVPTIQFTDSSGNENTPFRAQVFVTEVRSDDTADITLYTPPPMSGSEDFTNVSSNDTLIINETLGNGNTLTYELEIGQVVYFDDGSTVTKIVDLHRETFYLTNDSQEYYVDYAYGNDFCFEGNSYGQPKAMVSELSTVVEDGANINIQPGIYIEETQWSPTNVGTNGISYTINAFADTDRTDYTDVELKLGKWITDGNFAYSPWGKYVVWIWKGIGGTNNGGTIGYYADDCTLVDSDRFLDDDYVMENYVDSDDMHEIYAGFSLILEDGYKIDVNDVSDDGVAYVEVVKDGNVIDSLLDVTDGYEYVLYTTIQGNDYPTLAFHVWNVYYSSEYTSVTFDGLWQTSDYAELIS